MTELIQDDKSRSCEICDEFVLPELSRFRHCLPGSTDRRFASSEPGLRVLPTLGALAVGHVLLVPERHFTSLAAANRAGLNVLAATEALRLMVEARFGPTVLFEHGSESDGSSGGCGVTHAHMHCVPAVGMAKPPKGLPWKSVSASGWLLSEKGSDYMMFSPDRERYFLSGVGGVPSQWMRAQVAGQLGVNEWNWRDDPRKAVVEDTYEWLKSQSSQVLLPSG